MEFQHVSQQLIGYRDGTLSEAEMQHVQAHLERCLRCQEEYVRLCLSLAFVQNLPRESAPDTLWARIESALAEPVLKRNVRREIRSADSSRRQRFTMFATASLSLALIAGLVLSRRKSPPIVPPHPVSTASWEVQRLAGEPRVNANSIGKQGRLGVGQWLVTDAASKAELKVADIGLVEIAPNTRVRLIETRVNTHRLSLAHGELRARILAPPRLFFVETPSATAVDLGCAYTLTVDNAGNSLLHVTAGYVALATRGHETTVPAGAVCATRPNLGTGTPYFVTAPADLVAALTQFDFENGGKEALKLVLAKARAQDTLTLWHLLSRVQEADRGLVYDRLATIFPPPRVITRKGILRLDPKQLDRWKAELETFW